MDTKVIGRRYPHSVDGRISDHRGQIFVDGGVADPQLAAQGGELPGRFAVTAIYRGYVCVADATPGLDVEPGNEAAPRDPDPDSRGHGHLPHASRHSYLDGRAFVTGAASDDRPARDAAGGGAWARRPRPRRRPGARPAPGSPLGRGETR